ncbi:MAG: type II secretion system ATPase GspE [Nitrospiria bacterium]
MAVPKPKRKMLGELLIASGLLTPDQLEIALREQKQKGGRIGRILKTLKFVTEEEIIKVLGSQMGIPHMLLENLMIDQDVLNEIPEITARRHQVFPVSKRNKTLTLAMADPLNVFAIDEIKKMTGLEIQPVVSTENDISRAIERFYGMNSSLSDALKDMPSVVLENDLEAKARIDAMVEDAPVIKLVNSIILQAVQEGGSDIHIEPESDTIRVRFRVDGLLREVMQSSKTLHAGLCSRIKVMANLDISEKRVSQDGRIQIALGGRDIDIRVNTLPTIFGEKIVLRLLDKGNLLINMEGLGFSSASLIRFNKFLKMPYGLLLVTGPTGSGKTTTLYAALNQMNSMDKNIVTIEDPVEYQLKKINQVQVNSRAGVLFSTGLRNILRQDPDIVMVGEIRDKETASIAIQAALTGHLVLTTLHTNDAASSIARLMDMGIEPFLIASSLLGILAQRLVRRVCSFCKEPHTPLPEVIEEFHFPPGTVFMKGKGCAACRQSGYKGRTGLFELLQMDDSVRRQVISKTVANEISESARKNGMESLRQQGIAKVAAGETTFEEVLRVTQDNF